MLYKIMAMILGLPKSILLNFKYLNIKDAIKLPIIATHKVCLSKVSGSLQIDAPIKTGMIKLGFNNVGIFDRYKQRAIWAVSGNIIFRGNASLGHGTKISVGKNGELVIGRNLTITAETAIVCEKSIKIGDDCLISWDNLIMDTDFHNIIDKNGKIINEAREITIGDKVWIGCRNTILKGSKINNNTVVGASSLITRDIHNNNCIIAGNPIEVIKENISWS